jgi:hypothetical protein
MDLEREFVSSLMREGIVVVVDYATSCDSVRTARSRVVVISQQWARTGCEDLVGDVTLFLRVEIQYTGPEIELIPHLL